MGARPLHYSIMVLDLERFGSRTNPEQERARGALYSVVEEALKDADVMPQDVAGVGDRGDGGFWLFSSNVSKVDLTGDVVDRLQARLRAHAAGPGAPPLRLRLALHAGEVARDEHGWVGADLNTACRLVDLDDLRRALAAADRSALAVAVSGAWHDAVVRHGYPGLESSAFRPVPFREKEVDSTAWIRVPGYDAPPGLDAVRVPAPEAEADGAAEAQADEPASASSDGQASRFANAVFHHVGRLYGGDHHEVVRGDGTGRADR
ncbi:hypothetical protein [Streptomyces sp. NPDC047315]|uniref:hypothetical protein n=1 Tax=Streptomyces sp. NPDC047315 TaxID=3155142 RepID=UPI0033F8EE8F